MLPLTNCVHLNIPLFPGWLLNKSDSNTPGSQCLLGCAHRPAGQCWLCLQPGALPSLPGLSAAFPLAAGLTPSSPLSWTICSPELQGSPGFGAARGLEPSQGQPQAQVLSKGLRLSLSLGRGSQEDTQLSGQFMAAFVLGFCNPLSTASPCHPGSQSFWCASCKQLCLCTSAGRGNFDIDRYLMAPHKRCLLLSP